jgi:hypothetical protein
MEMEILQQYTSHLLNERLQNQIEIEKLTRRVESLLQSNQSLQENNNIMQKKFKRTFFSRSKPFTQAKRRQRQYNTKKIRKIFEDTDNILSAIDLKIKSIKCINKCASTEPFQLKIETNPVPEHNDEHSPEYALFVVECLRLSRDQYNLLRKLMSPNWPTWYQLELIRSEIDQQHVIHASANGYIVDVKKTIRSRLEEYIERGQYNSGEVFEVKLSLDGTEVGRKLKMLNVTFTIPNDKDNCLSASGNYSLGMFCIKQEKYSVIQRCVKKIFKQIEDTKDKIKIRENVHRLKFTLSGDWKILAIITGIKAPTSNNPCLFCICSKNRLHLKQNFTARSSKNDTVLFGKRFPSLLPRNIPLANVIPDTLHLHLRVTDVLQKLVHKELYTTDKYRQNEKYDPVKHHNTERYLKFMNDTCNMNYVLYENHKKGIVEGRSLRGDEKTKVFVNINIKQIMPENPNSDALQKIIDDYIFIYKQIVQSKTCPTKLERLTSAWMNQFLKTYHSTYVTPYMHLMVNHLHESYSTHGNVYLYNQQGLEKLNSITTAYYFRGTNMKLEPIKQILLKRLRGDWLKQRFTEEFKVIIGLFV